MAEATETVTLKLPSGEEVDAIVPSGMSDSQVHDLMKQKHPEYFRAPSQPEQQPSFMQRLTAGYNTGAEDFDQRHPILGKPVRYLDRLGGMVLGAPSALYHAAADPETSEESERFGKGFEKKIGPTGRLIDRMVVQPIMNAGEDYASGKVTPKKALSVLPEATADITAGLGVRTLAKGSAAPKSQGLPEVQSGGSRAIDLLQDSLAQKRTPAPRLSEGLPEVEEGQGAATAHLHKAIPVSEMGNARMELTPRRLPGEVAPEQVAVRAGRGGTISAQPIPARSGLLLKGEVEPVYPGAPQPQATPELLQSRPLAIGARTPPPDQSAGLGSIPVKTGPQPAPITKARVGNLLDQATGAKPLAKGIPIKQQLDRVTPAPKESSVIKSHNYDPEAKELTLSTHNGQTYKYGDVSPEQAADFTSGSKGQAFNRLKKSGSVLMEKNGIPVKPSGPSSASPDDLVPLLEESVRQAKANQ